MCVQNYITATRGHTLRLPRAAELRLGMLTFRCCDQSIQSSSTRRQARIIDPMMNLRKTSQTRKTYNESSTIVGQRLLSRAGECTRWRRESGAAGTLPRRTPGGLQSGTTPPTHCSNASVKQIEGFVHHLDYLCNSLVVANETLPTC